MGAGESLHGVGVLQRISFAAMPDSKKSADAPAQLSILAISMVFGMMPWFAASVSSAAMAAEWQASPGFEAWLTIAVQLGFVLGTLLSAILMVSDRWSARR